MDFIYIYHKKRRRAIDHRRNARRRGGETFHLYCITKVSGTQMYVGSRVGNRLQFTTIYDNYDKSEKTNEKPCEC